jgi:hypothetical protein
LQLRSDNDKLSGENKGHVRELKMLRSIAQERVKHVTDEGGGALKNAAEKLREMEEEIGKVKKMVQEGEKLKIFLVNSRKEELVKEQERAQRASAPATPVVRRGSILRTPSPIKPAGAPGSAHPPSPISARRVSFSESGPAVGVINEDGSLNLPPPTAVATPTRFAAGKKGTMFAQYDIEDDGGSTEDEFGSSDDDDDDKDESSRVPAPPGENAEMHKKRVRELLFGMGGKGALGGGGFSGV